VVVEGKIARESNDLLEGTNQHSSALKNPESNLLRNVRSAERKEKRNKKKDKETKGPNSPRKNNKGKKVNKKREKKIKKMKGNKSAKRNNKGKKRNKTKGIKGRPRNTKKNKNKTKVKLTKQTKKAKQLKKKSKKEEDRKRKTRKNKQTPPSSTCRTTVRSVSELCIQDAMLSLAYEKNQVTNYIKQAKRLDNHENISANKLTKKDEFSSAAKHMLWAIGGNLSNPLCGETTTDTKRQERLNRDLKSSIANYYKLLNCSNSINEACDLKQKNESYSHDDHTENMTLCRTYKADFIKVSKECVSNKDQANATLQCECWHKAAKDVAIIKKLKCATKAQQKIVTQHKNDCIKAFGKCKKMEDDAIELIHTCMHDHSNNFINQTAQGLHDAAEKAGRAMLKERLALLDMEATF